MTIWSVAPLLAALAVTSGCRDNPHTPQWLHAQIAEIESEPISNPPTELFRYRYEGEVVYYRPPRCCDVQGELFDAQGKTLCFPSGGITGKGDGRCPAFLSGRSDCVVVWSDPRAKAAALRGCSVAVSPRAPEY